jgi:hypothetical protein
VIRGTTFAAARAITSRAATLRARVFVFILEQGERGATLEEIEQGMGMPGNTVRPRRVELEEKGWVKDSGMTRETRSGRKAIVWVVPPDVAAKAHAHFAKRAT